MLFIEARGVETRGGPGGPFFTHSQAPRRLAFLVRGRWSNGVINPGGRSRSGKVDPRGEPHTPSTVDPRLAFSRNYLNQSGGVPYP